jgi:hypothetical protein
MAHRGPRGFLLAVLLLALIATVSPASGEESGPSIGTFVRETQKSTSEAGRVRVVWWIPEQFWSLSFQRSGGLTAEKQEEFIKTVRPYLIIAAVDGKIGALGGADFVDEATVRAGLKVIDAQGRSYPPIPTDELNGDVKNLSAMLASAFSNMLGAMGQSMKLFYFPAKTSEGNSIAAAAEEGSFSVELAGESFRWRTPLASLMQPKTCPVDGESMSGSWKYCPWHGKKLDEPSHKDDPSHKDEPARKKEKPSSG